MINKLKDLERRNNAEKHKTALEKAKFIKEIKTGLGEEIRKNPNNFEIKKKSKLQIIKDFLKKIFIKF